LAVKMTHLSCRNSKLRQADDFQSWKALVTSLQDAHSSSLKIDFSVLIPFRFAVQDFLTVFLTFECDGEVQQKQLANLHTLHSFISLLLGKFALNFSPPLPDFLNLITPILSTLSSSLNVVLPQHPPSLELLASFLTILTTLFAYFDGLLPISLAAHAVHSSHAILLSFISDLIKRQANARNVFESLVLFRHPCTSSVVIVSYIRFVDHSPSSRRSHCAHAAPCMGTNCSFFFECSLIASHFHSSAGTIPDFSH